MPYTERSKENLVREGIERERIFVTGNPIGEVLTHYRAADRRQRCPEPLRCGSRGGFFLLTMHRAENVDDPDRLARLVDAVVDVSREYGAAGALQRPPAHRRPAAGWPA